MREVSNEELLDSLSSDELLRELVKYQSRLVEAGFVKAAGPDQWEAVVPDIYGAAAVVCTALEAHLLAVAQDLQDSYPYDARTATENAERVADLAVSFRSLLVGWLTGEKLSEETP